MVLNRLSEAGGRGAGGFLGGVANNPGIIAIVAIIAALVLFRGDIRNAFASIPEAISNIGSVELPDITLPDITFPTFNFPEITFPEFPAFPEFPSFDFLNIFGPKDEPVMVSPEQMALNEMELAKCECGTSAISQDALGIVKVTCSSCEMQEAEIFGPIGPLDPNRPIRLQDIVPETDQQTESTFSGIMQTIVSMLPGPMQTFFGGGPSFIGGTIFENPIDTFSEVLENFPELTASQAADFLLETGGRLLPSQVDFFDPDIRNIVANIGGENVQVDTTTFPSELQSEAIRAACVSCENFNLNCEQCAGGMA